MEMNDATGKKVSFGPDVKPPAPETPASSRAASAVPPPEPVEEAANEVLDGVVGHLNVYKSGAVKLVLGDGIVLDVRHPNCYVSATH